MADFTSSYFGRYVDVYVMALPEPGFEGEADLRFGSITKVCSGIQKLAQLYMINLLTAVGSKLLAPTDGSGVGNLVIGGSSPGVTRLRHIINIGNAQTVDLILGNQADILDAGTEPIPDDELLIAATPISVDVTQCDSASFTVLLETAADVGTFVIPLPLVP